MNLATLRANWRTSLSGIGAAFFSLLTIIAALPYQLGDVATLIPSEWKARIAIASAIAAFLLKTWNAIASKDAVVVGNGTPFEPVKTPDGHGGNRVLSTILVFALLSGALTGCAWLQKPTTKSQLTATGSWLLGKAADLAIGAVVNAAQSQADARNKADWLDSLAAGIRTEATASFSGEDIRRLVGIWTPEKPHWQLLAGQLADLAKQAASLPPAQRNEALAQAVQLAAQIARAKPASAFTAPPAEHRLDPPGAPFPLVVTALP